MIGSDQTSWVIGIWISSEKPDQSISSTNSIICHLHVLCVCSSLWSFRSFWFWSSSGLGSVVSNLVPAPVAISPLSFKKASSAACLWCLSQHLLISSRRQGLGVLWIKTVVTAFGYCLQGNDLLDPSSVLLVQMTQMKLCSSKSSFPLLSSLFSLFGRWWRLTSLFLFLFEITANMMPLSIFTLVKCNKIKTPLVKLASLCLLPDQRPGAKQVLQDQTALSTQHALHKCKNSNIQGWKI